MDSIKADKNEIVLSTNSLKYLDHNFEYPFPKIKWHHSSSNEINKIIKSLKPKGSAGYNDIPLKILKISALFIVSPLIYIYMQPCLVTRNFSRKIKILYN